MAYLELVPYLAVEVEEQAQVSNHSYLLQGEGLQHNSVKTEITQKSENVLEFQGSNEADQNLSL